MKRTKPFFALLSIMMLISLITYSGIAFPQDAWAYAGDDDDVCEGTPYQLLGAAASGYASLLWTTSGSGSFNDPTLVNATYSPGIGELGPVVLTLTAYALPPGNDDSDDMTLNIFDGPEASFTSSPADTAFVNSSIQFSGSATTAIDSWDWDFGDGNTATGQQVNHSYFAVGIYVVQLIVSNINGCIDTTTQTLVVIDPIIDFFMNPSPSCEAYQVSFTGIGGTGPGEYTWDFGDGNTATGQNVFHTYSNADTYLVTLDYASEQIQKNLVVVAPPFSDAGADDWMCSDIPYTLSGTASNYSSLMWESSGDGGFDDPSLLNASYSAGTADIAAGTVTLSLISYANIPCTNDTSSITLSIQAAAVSDAGADTASCDGAAVSLNGFVLNEDSHSWSTAGDGSFDDPLLLNATYTAGAGDLANGSVILSLTATAILPCDTDAVDDLLLDLPVQPICNAGDDGQMCNINPYTLNGTASDYSSVFWSSSGDGTFDDPELLNATYTPGSDDIANGSVNLTLTAFAYSPCNDASDDMILSIQSPPMANAGDDAGICEGETVQLCGTASDYLSVSWNTDGDGSFNDPTILNPIYTPGGNDISSGGASLSLSANPVLPCTIDMTDAMALGIDPAVGSAFTPEGPEIVDSYLTPSTEYQTQSSTAADEYKWSLFPSSAGDISGTGIIGTVLWEPAYQGLAHIKVTAFNSCNSITSDSLEVNVSTSVGLPDYGHIKTGIKIMPNPSNGIFSIQLEGFQSGSMLSLLDYFGRKIMEIPVGNDKSPEQSFNLSHLPKGIYILKLAGPNTMHTEKIVIQ